MEFDENLIYNFASIIATVLFVSAAGITIGRKLKLRWPVSVNCWFCNKDAKIYRDKLNWWLCPTCEQYNGFTKDGDYAHDIPEQRRQSKKNFAKTTSSSRKTDAKESLCDECNRKEELKVAELRTFETEWFFDSRLENFKKKLELKYPLCDNCSCLVENVLHKQSTWLTQYKMLFFKQKSINGYFSVNNPKNLDKTVRIFLTMLTSMTICYPSYWPLPIAGAFLQTSAFVINQAHKRTWDAILTLLWIFISLVGPLNQLSSINYHVISEWPPVGTITEYQFVTSLTLIIGFTNIFSRYRNRNSFKASFKKLESPVGKKNFSSMQNNVFDNLDSSGEIEMRNYSNYRQSSKELDTSSTTKSPLFAQNLRKHQNQDITSPPSTIVNTASSSSYSNHKHTIKLEPNSEQYTLNDSLSTLKTLTLGESRSPRSPKLPRIFKTKIYGSTSPDLFQRSIKSSSTKKFVLAPPKLKSVAQTSWVAGGYWQIDVEPTTLSRSSSQSSGFGSAGSNFGPSREPSISKDVDKCSIVSETQYFHSSRPNSVDSSTSCCKHISPMQLSRCENNVCNQNLGSVTNTFFNNNNSQTLFSPVNPEVSGCFEHVRSCRSLQNRGFNAAIVEKNRGGLNCRDGCHAVLTSPVWLGILLCGSLVFNIAVFCTIMMR